MNDKPDAGSNSNVDYHTPASKFADDSIKTVRTQKRKRFLYETARDEAREEFTKKNCECGSKGIGGVMFGYEVSVFPNAREDGSGTYLLIYFSDNPKLSDRDKFKEKEWLLGTDGKWHLFENEVTEIMRIPFPDGAPVFKFIDEDKWEPKEKTPQEG